MHHGREGVARISVHLAGVAAKSNVIRGVPRLKELLKVTRNPKATSLTVNLRPDIRANKTDAHAVLLDLELTTLRDLALNARIYYNAQPNSVGRDDSDFVRYVNAFNGRMDAARGEAPAPVAAARPGAAAAPGTPWILRLELDREKMLEKNVSMEDISLALGKLYGGKLMNTIYTDTNFDRLVVRIPLDGLATVNDTDHIQVLRTVQNTILDNTIIRGVPGIKGVSMEKMEFAKQIEERKTAKGDRKSVLNTLIKNVQTEYDASSWIPIEEWVLSTNGSNFLEVLNHSSVDGTRLLSNNIHDINENLGIEATRTVLMQEIQNLFEDSGAFVNVRHIMLLVDTMTSKGRTVSVDRYGVNKTDIGPIAKASFEETQDILNRAACYGELDPVVGVSSNIMFGQNFRGGTSWSTILLDVPEMLKLNAERPPERAIVDYSDRVDAELGRAGGQTGAEMCSQLPSVVPVTMPQERVQQPLADIFDELAPTVTA